MKKQNLADSVVEFVLLQNDEELAALTVKRIANHFDVNPSYLSRRFMMDKKISLGDLILRVKIFRSTLILRENKDLTINEVARKMGFCTPGYFINVFKKYFGTSPGKYRECVRD
jgi:two-component system response regulator YesN